jgi:hypothetical protein
MGIKYFVLLINGTWKEIEKSEVRYYLDYGCTVKKETK